MNDKLRKLRCALKPVILLLIAASLSAAAIVGYSHTDGVHRSPTAKERASNPYREWNVAGGDAGATKYSALDQIDRSNVGELEIAWIYRTDDVAEKTKTECNPIVVDGVLYATSPQLDVFALNAATGEEIWRIDPTKIAKLGGKSSENGVNRGVAYWRREDDERIIFTYKHWLIALDAQNGSIIADFGDGGKVDLRRGLSRPFEQLSIESTSAPVLYEDLVILGGRGNYHGVVRAYDIPSGQLRWLFNVVPHPGEPYYETWPKEAWKTIQGANAWGGMSVDEQNGLVFFSTGGPKPDFFGWLYPGENIFANSVVALEAATGEYKWHFQEIKHDIWDLDLPAPPVLVDVEHEGERRAAVAQVSKTGNTFLLDRFTGESLFPLVEAPVPASDIPLETPWPTQIVPLRPPPFSRQSMSKDDITRISQEAYEDALKRFLGTRSGWFRPVSTKGTILYGVGGGASWPGGAFRPTTGLFYVASSNLPYFVKLNPIFPGDGRGAVLFGSHCAACHGDRDGKEGAMPGVPGLFDIDDRYTREELLSLLSAGRNAMPSFESLGDDALEEIAAYLRHSDSQDGGRQKEKDEPIGYEFNGWAPFKDIYGYPAVKPPWGVLTAIDLNEGEIVWQTPIGEHAELTMRGIPPTGTILYGGPIATAGDLVFMAGSRDEKIRALDAITGEILWTGDLPYGGYANPATYEVDGRQFVVIAAGGGGLNHTKAGDAYVAFALPKR